MKEKNALIAKFTPIVVQSAMPFRQAIVHQNCAVCHRFNGEGKDIPPDLTGMGAHVRRNCVHVLDPNREVGPTIMLTVWRPATGNPMTGSFRENANSLTLRQCLGVSKLKLLDVKSRRNTGLSLMPNGFEAWEPRRRREISWHIFARGNRIIACWTCARFHREFQPGMWIREDDTENNPAFKKFGLVKVDEIPFEIVNPLKATSGNNVIVLKGGTGFAQTKPQRVEIPNVGVLRPRLHFSPPTDNPTSHTAEENPGASQPLRHSEFQRAGGFRLGETGAGLENT